MGDTDRVLRLAQRRGPSLRTIIGLVLVICCIIGGALGYALSRTSRASEAAVSPDVQPASAPATVAAAPSLGAVGAVTPTMNKTPASGAPADDLPTIQDMVFFMPTAGGLGCTYDDFIERLNQASRDVRAGIQIRHLTVKKTSDGFTFNHMFTDNVSIYGSANRKKELRFLTLTANSRGTPEGGKAAFMSFAAILRVFNPDMEIEEMNSMLKRLLLQDGTVVKDKPTSLIINGFRYRLMASPRMGMLFRVEDVADKDDD